ncbi:hypothetical protein C0Q70_03312 [Pomacea canaliculata]|uniref:Uncharacterized protein n=1 Tax=Pomacea canaliculata TaxID=400727 RepID=A0A2T7PSD4_POMCA|nr:hypothetical protein C0Q70_03312 [Pomacea canaliculata]
MRRERSALKSRRRALPSIMQTEGRRWVGVWPQTTALCERRQQITVVSVCGIYTRAWPDQRQTAGHVMGQARGRCIQAAIIQQS